MKAPGKGPIVNNGEHPLSDANMGEVALLLPIKQAAGLERGAQRQGLAVGSSCAALSETISRVRSCGRGHS
jgi:hypothetical protein